MPQGSAGMLRALAGGVCPVDGMPPRVRDAPRDRETLDFDRLLGQAAAGTLRSWLPVRVPHALVPEVDGPTHDALAEATDRAATEGIRHAAVLLGSRLFRVDVAARSVIDAPPAQERTVRGIDGVVIGDGSNADAPGGTPEHVSGPATGPARVVRNASLAQTLADVGGGEA